MRRILVFAVFAATAFAVAAVLRARDAPYIAYERGDVSTALNGLTVRAESGDGFAAYLIAHAHAAGMVGSADPRAAAAWFMAAARLGEIRAVAPYLRIVLRPPSDPATCRTALVLLELAARAGDAGALELLGTAHLSGLCVPTDRLRAAAYYRAAERLDRRLHSFFERLTPPLSAEESRALRPSPETFDLNARQVLARFSEEAPALLPDALR